MGRWEQKPQILVATSAKTGSMDEKMVPQSPLLTMNSVMDAMINTEDSARTSCKALSRFERWTQSMSWAVFIDSREAIFSPVIFRRKLASPITEKSREIDILMMSLQTLSTCLMYQNNELTRFSQLASWQGTWTNNYTKRTNDQNRTYYRMKDVLKSSTCI